MRPVTKRLAVAAGLMAVVLSAAGSALARDYDDDYGWKHKHRHGPPFVPPGHVYYVERPVVYAPPPRVYYPEPMYYGPAPLPPPSININIPLR
jgi:hypothetical protein